MMSLTGFRSVVLLLMSQNKYWSYLAQSNQALVAHDPCMALSFNTSALEQADPNDDITHAVFQQADILLAMEEYEPALKVYQYLLSKSSGTLLAPFKVRLGIARCQLGLGRLEAAQAALSSAISYLPVGMGAFHPEVIWFSGKLFLAVGKIARANESFAKARSLGFEGV